MAEKNYVLGVSSHFHDSAAALVCDSEIIAAAQEERFSRIKADWRFPANAIAYCLSQLPAGAKISRLAYYEDPAIKARRIIDTARFNAPRGALLWPRIIETLKGLSNELPEQLLNIAGDADKIYFVPHHRSHAASAFYPSPFQDAAVLVMDGVGEWSTTTIWSGDETGLQAESEIKFPHSLGLFYSAFTQYCGFKVNSGEYKLMGLAPFGVPQFRNKILTELIDVREDGSFALNMDYFAFDKALSTISPLFELLFGQPPRKPTDPITPFYMNMAASAQAVLEETVLKLARTALKRTGKHNLCLAGGVALNCVANGRLARELETLEGFWIQPAAGDAGGALGAALEVSRTGTIKKPALTGSHGTVDGMKNGFLGPNYRTETIRQVLDQAQLCYEEILDENQLIEMAAEALCQQNIVGHFDGAMEFGPRALGNRSILADPRGKQTLSHVNRMIKFREGWRPFAPMVLQEQAGNYFETPTQSPYMLCVSKLKPAYRGPTTLADARQQGHTEPLALQQAVNSAYAAVTHVDHSARLQTICAETGSRAGKFLKVFFEKTGCPMLLNTSFNVRGEPIICSPQHAVDCFLNTHLDVLVIGRFLVRKSAQSEDLKAKVGGKTFAAD